MFFWHRHFEQLAVGVLSECYTSDESRTHKLLVRELPLFGESTIIALAVEADNKTFIAHAACQTLFNKIWAGRLTEDNYELLVREDFQNITSSDFGKVYYNVIVWCACAGFNRLSGILFFTAVVVYHHSTANLVSALSWQRGHTKREETKNGNGLLLPCADNGYVRFNVHNMYSYIILYL